MAYSLYLNIELRLPQQHIAAKLNRLFVFPLDSSTIGHFRTDAAENSDSRIVSVPTELNGEGDAVPQHSAVSPFSLFESPNQGRKVHFYAMDCVSKFVEISLH